MGSALNSCDVRADLEHLLPITEIGEDPSLETLDLVDAAQRLGVDYRFQTEIDLILESHYAIANSPGDDLHQVALRFRLLRQRGYFVSSGVAPSHSPSFFYGILCCRVLCVCSFLMLFKS